MNEMLAQIHAVIGEYEAKLALQPVGVEIDQTGWDRLLAFSRADPKTKPVPGVDRLLAMPLYVRDDLRPGEFALRFRS